MITRYSRKELTNIWSEENKYKIWLDVEVAAAEAMEKYKIIPKGVASIVRKKGKIKVKRIHDIESKVKHDVIAFLTSITEQAGIKARYLHQGMTSSDVLDTSFNLQLVQSGKILIKDIDKILSVLKRQAKKHKLTPENVVDIQRVIGSDIMMMLDVCPSGDDSLKKWSSMESLMSVRPSHIFPNNR